MINIPKVHVYSAAGAFFAKKNKKKLKYEIIKKIHKKGNLFSAAGAFLAKKCSTNHEKYENI